MPRPPPTYGGRTITHWHDQVTPEEPHPIWICARDERLWEARQPHSTCEAAEQGRESGFGGGGGKGAGRGEHGQQDAPRTQGRNWCVNMRWIVCAGEGLAQSDAGPEPGAQCGSSARWDLCGGPPERAVPTASLLEEV